MAQSFQRFLQIPGLLPGLTFLTILGLWELSTRILTIPSFLLPAPSRIAEGLDAVTVSRWTAHIWATLRVAMLGFLTAIIVSLPPAIVLIRAFFAASFSIFQGHGTKVMDPKSVANPDLWRSPARPMQTTP